MAIPGAAGAGGGAAVAVAIAEAIKASGALVRIEPVDFDRMLRRMDAPLVIHAETGLRKTKHEYMTSYRGFIFHTKTDTPIRLPDMCETIKAKKIWIPG